MMFYDTLNFIYIDNKWQLFYVIHGKSKIESDAFMVASNAWLFICDIIIFINQSISLPQFTDQWRSVVCHKHKSTLLSSVDISELHVANIPLVKCWKQLRKWFFPPHIFIHTWTSCVIFYHFVKFNSRHKLSAGGFQAFCSLPHFAWEFFIVSFLSAVCRLAGANNEDVIWLGLDGNEVFCVVGLNVFKKAK